jgi:hypothetical protein
MVELVTAVGQSVAVWGLALWVAWRQVLRWVLVWLQAKQ